MNRGLSIVTLAAVFFGLAGCAAQPETVATDVSLGVMGPKPAAARAVLWANAAAVASGEERAEASEQVMLANPAGPIVLPARADARTVERVPQPVFFLGAGDALGEQIFITYVAALRAEEAYVTGFSAYPAGE